MSPANPAQRATAYHLQVSGPCLPHWPNGCVAVYEINGDQIAERVVRAEVVKHENGAYYTGPVIARHSWPGYIGMVASVAEVPGLIERHEAEYHRRHTQRGART